MLYEVLPGLPPYGPPPVAFPPDFARTGREGFVVRFLPHTPDSWVGNFGGGLGGHTGVHPHPDGTRVVVIASGRALVIDPSVRAVQAEIGSAIDHVWPVEDPAGYVFDHQGLAFSRWGGDGQIWQSRRLSWDGFRDVRLTADEVTGLAWTPVGDLWIPFRIDLRRGRSEGGSYEGPDPIQGERLAE